MRIAVATQDDATVTGHFRQSTRFVVFVAQDGRVEAQGIREYDNPASDGHHASVLGLLEGCDALICGALADKIAGQLQQHGIEPVVAQDTALQPEEAARQFAAGTLLRGEIHRCCCDH